MSSPVCRADTRHPPVSFTYQTTTSMRRKRLATEDGYQRLPRSVIISRTFSSEEWPVEPQCHRHRYPQRPPQDSLPRKIKRMKSHCDWHDAACPPQSARASLWPAAAALKGSAGHIVADWM